MTHKGLFIVMYGPSGVGKTRELDMLEEKLKNMGCECKRVQYPIFRLGEAGPKLEKIVWGRVPRIPEEEMQTLFAQNRRDFDPTLRSWLDSGVTVLAEDYYGTGVVWGVTRGVSMEKMEQLNEGAVQPDISILIDGPRRIDLREGEGHIYNIDEEEWYRARKVYLQMADKYGWVRVGGDAPIITVGNRIWTIVKLALAMRVK
jgi:thymidylate kinase